MFWIGLIVGFFVGALSGSIVMAFFAGSDRQKRYEPFPDDWAGL